MVKKLTLGMLLAAFGILSFYFLTFSFLSGDTPVEEYAKGAALSEVPDKVNAVMSVATIGGGIFVAIIIILIVIFWDKIMDFNLLELLDYLPSWNSEGSGGL